MPERVYAFGASLLLAVPVVRHIMSWMGVVPADKQVMLDVLSQASGGALPEGIAGIFTGASRFNASFHLPSCCPILALPPPLNPLPCLVPGDALCRFRIFRYCNSFPKYPQQFVAGYFLCCIMLSGPEAVTVCKLHYGMQLVHCHC